MEKRGLKAQRTGIHDARDSADRPWDELRLFLRDLGRREHLPLFLDILPLVARADERREADEGRPERDPQNCPQPSPHHGELYAMVRRLVVAFARMVLSLVDLIAKKRDGREHEHGELDRLLGAFASGELADYQMSAWLMAVFFRGMTTRETVALTQAMLRSGETVDLSALQGIKVDKHSTGGVGDKVSICLAPLVAACGVKVPMVSGRGLGHTGGTLDKLESIPGFRTDLTIREFVQITGEVGACMIGQTSEIAPSDKRMYALRDVTATVESVPLIVSSILSKKLAEGIDGLVLDVKVGRGAFMRDLAHALELAHALVDVGTRAGKRVTALLTDMSAPLGRAIGNANEAREAILLLHGQGPADLLECTMALGVEILRMAGRDRDPFAAKAELERAIDSGRALRVLERMVAAQGGDARVVQDPHRLEVAPPVAVRAEESGFVSAIDALEMGLVAVALGAGRTRADQHVDFAVGLSIETKPGERVSRGDTLAHIHVRDPETAEMVRERVLRAFTLTDTIPQVGPLLLGRVGA
jgi:pyrimidine-nucleoside phosphorylase